jgi:ribA/ribD-fused uncharacterized protein
MESLLPPVVKSDLSEMVRVATQDKRAELELKVLAGQIQTKDVADRIVQAIEDMTTGGFTVTNRATFSYPDGLRVSVSGVDAVYKLATTASFRNLPLEVERKRRYFDVGKSGKDVLDIPDLKLRATLRHEEPLRKDFSGSPMDPASHARIMNRKSWVTTDKIFRIDMSLVKTKQKSHKTFSEILDQPPAFELEVELIDKTAAQKDILASLYRTLEPLLAAYQQSAFLLTEADLQRYHMELDAMRLRFVQPVTMVRSHLRADRPYNILNGYTVTNKADGERCFLVVARDRRLLRWYRDGRVAWTGITATKDIHIGDVLDGEFLSDRNLFCIFDAYQFRGKNILRLPLMTTDSDVSKEPLKSRLGCASLFVDDLKKDFLVLSARQPMRIETKVFLAGNGAAMQQAIRSILDMQFEYPTDGLVFTPRSSPVAPISDRKGDTWLRVYKWKPADQNSIDFLVSFAKVESFDPLLGSSTRKGTLFVGRTPGSDIVYPCETLTGEYRQPELSPEMRVLAESRDRAPSPFQPSAPKAPNAYEIHVPIGAKGFPEDIHGNRVDDNTIIECVRDVEKGRWKVLRTRYDKTYKYRVLGMSEYGNDINVAEDIWTNIHVPVTEEMLRSVFTSPVDDTFEDELYYRDSLEARDRSMSDVMAFHNRIKDELYRTVVKRGDTLLELAVGRANDLHKWRKTQPSKVVGIDLSRGNIEGARQGACVRYLKEAAKSRLPPALFIEGDMTQPLLEQDNRYIKMLDKREPAPTEYLQRFVGLTEFDVISCQMAMHYACASEETFRAFVGNLTRMGKGMFFGTCMDGQAVYSLLLGKTGYMFRAPGQVFGEITKEYADADGWTEDFGKAITVKLESFEKPEKEYLVPFGKVTEILKENGYELVSSTSFKDHYATQNQTVLTGDLQEFSFLHRSFIFKRVAAPEKKEEPPAQTVEVPMAPQETAPKEEGEPKEEGSEPTQANEPKPATTEKPKKRTLKAKVPSEPAEEPVFFFSGNPALNEYKEFSNMYEAPFQIEGTTFPTVEHYFQWSKARMFGDAAIQEKILKTSSPKSVKALGKKVTGFKEDEWAEKKDGVMAAALKAKFMQHPELLKKLRDTGTRRIAEADPRGKYWGIGTSSDTSKAKDPERWPGKNKMGSLLEALRSELKE